jgi:hypothetical protein
MIPVDPSNSGPFSALQLRVFKTEETRSSKMPEIIAIVGASGKLGAATLSALLKYNLVAPTTIVAITSS